MGNGSPCLDSCIYKEFLVAGLSEDHVSWDTCLNWQQMPTNHGKWVASRPSADLIGGAQLLPSSACCVLGRGFQIMQVFFKTALFCLQPKHLIHEH